MRVRNISKKVKGYMKIHRKQSYRKTIVVHKLKALLRNVLYDCYCL